MAEILTQGGIYLTRLDPAKKAEIGKIRPAVILSGNYILKNASPLVFVCPLSHQSHPNYSSLHVFIPARDSLYQDSYALPEHCRSISTSRLIYPRLAELTTYELKTLIHHIRLMMET